MDHRPKCTITQVSEENLGENLCNLGLGEESLDWTPQHDS